MADGKVVIEVDADDSGLDRKLQNVESKFISTGKAISSVGTKISNVGADITKYITVPAIAAGTAAFNLASDYEESLNKVDVAFAESAEDVKDWAQTATDQFGLSESAALSATALYGDMATSMGFAQDVAADMATELTGLAGDLASFKNIGIDQAMTALNGVFTGETESLKMLGVVMTEVNLEEFAAGMGLVYKEMSQAEKVTLRYQYVMAKTANAHGDYARTSDGTANSVRTFTAELENLGATFGQELLPVITPAIQTATDLISEFGELNDVTKQIIISTVALAAASGPVIGAGGKLITTVGDLSTRWGEFLAKIDTGTTGFGTVAGALGLVTSAAFAFVGAVTAIAQAQNAANAENQRASDGLAGINVRTREATAAYQDSIASIEAEGASVSSLVTELSSLVESGDKSVETQAQIKSIVDELNAAVPNLGLAYDELTGKLNMTTDAVLELAEAERTRRIYDEMDEQLILLLEERAKLETLLSEAEAEQASALEAYNKAQEEYLAHMNDAPSVVSEYRDALNNATEDLEDAKENTEDCRSAYEDMDNQANELADQMSELSVVTDEVADSEEAAAEAADEQTQSIEEATKAIAKIGTKAYEAVESGSDLRDTYDELRKQMDELTGSGDPYIESLAEQNLRMLEIAATAEDLQTDYGDLASSIGVSSSYIASQLVAVGMSADDFAAGCESMRDRVINSFETISVNEELTAAQIAANLANNLAVHQSWSSNLISLWNGTQDSTIRAFILYMYDQGPEFALAVSQFANGGSEALASAAESWAAIGDETAQGYLARVAGAADLAGQTGSDFSSFLTTGMEEGVTGAETSGQSIAETMLESVTDYTGEAEDVGQQLGDSIIEGIDSKSSGYSSAGSNVAADILSGFKSRSDQIPAAASTTAAAIASAFSSQDWYSVGYGISSGVASGISGGSYLISYYATNAAKNALSAAKKALGINSPSKVFRDAVGMAIPEGIAAGVVKASPVAEKAVENSSVALLSKAQEVTRPTVATAATSHVDNNTSNYYGASGKSQVVTINIPVNLDGREVARSGARFIGEQMDWEEL